MFIKSLPNNHVSTWVARQKKKNRQYIRNLLAIIFAPSARARENLSSSKRAKCQAFPPVPGFGGIPTILPHPSFLLANEQTKQRAQTRRQRRNKKQLRTRGASPRHGGDASNQPVLAPGDIAQSNLDTSQAAASSGFIALDVGALSSIASDGTDTAAAAAPRTPKVVRSLSRKGERKPADGDSNGNTGGVGGGAGTGERPPLFVHVAAADEMNGLRLVHTPVAGTPGGKSRRLGRRPAPWLDPRRVVFLFATLSSVGTLVLLYFTLSMSRMDGAGNGKRR